jgi:hypothetical protein
VSESTRILIIFILCMLLLLALGFMGQMWMMKRALKSVFKTFRDNNALTPENAKLAVDLGFKRKSFLQVKAFRDYKPTAITMLQRQEIVLMTEDGRIYLSEEALLQSHIEERLMGKK